MARITTNCFCCNQILTDVVSDAEGCFVSCPDCAETNAQAFKDKCIPYSGGATDYVWWSGTTYNIALDSIPKLSATLTEKCDHCNKALNSGLTPTRYTGNVIWCSSCVSQESSFLTSCDISHRTDSITPTRWAGTRDTKVLKNYPQKSKAADYKELVAPCDHCGKELPYAAIPEGYDAPWCESCFTEDSKLLKDHLVPSGAFSKDRKIQAWQNSVPKVKKIPKKVVMSELITETKTENTVEAKTSGVYGNVCDHCNTKLVEPPSACSSEEVVWCNTCCVENEKFFNEKGLTKVPTNTSLHWRLWASPGNVTPIKAFPKKVIKVEEVKTETSKICCGHCSSEIIDPPVGEVRDGEMIWCETCCEENAAFLASKLTGTGVKNATNKWRRWEIINNVIVLKAFPKKAVKVEEVKKESLAKMVACDHCEKQIDVSKLPVHDTWWCKDCIKTDRLMLTDNMVSSTNTIKDSAGEIELIGWRGWNHIIKKIPKKSTVDKVVEEATKEVLLRTEVTVLPADKLVSCDHCGASLNAGDMPHLEIYWCGDCCKNDRALLEEKGAVFNTNEDVEKGHVSYRNAIKKDDGTIVYAGWKVLAPKIKEILKAGHTGANCDHCNKHLDVTKKPSFLVYWCNDCVDEKKDLLDSKDISRYSALNYTSEFHGWKDNAPFIKSVPKKGAKVEAVEEAPKAKNTKCDHCDKPLNTTSKPTYLVYWCNGCVAEEEEVLKKEGLTLHGANSTSEFHAWKDSAPIINKIPKKVIKVEETKKIEEVKVETCNCKHCNKLLDRKSIWALHGETDPYVWCKECIIANQDKTKGQLITLTPDFYDQQKATLGEFFTSASEIAKLQKISADLKVAAEKAVFENCNCGFCNKVLEKKKVYTAPIGPTFEYVLCKGCVFTHKDILAKKSVRTVYKDYYEQHPELIGEASFSLSEIERLKSYRGSDEMKNVVATKLVEAEKEKVIHIHTNCGHCAKDLDIQAAPNYDIYWCDACVKEEQAYYSKQTKGISGDAFSNGSFKAWKGDIATKVKLIGTKNDLANLRALYETEKKAAAEEVERIKSCTTTCQHCDKTIVFNAPVKPNTVEVAWCKECSIENKALLSAAEIPNGLCDQRWGTNRPKVIAIPKKPNTVCDHCNKGLHINGFNSAYNVAWCADCGNEDLELLKKAGVNAHTDATADHLWSDSKQLVESIHRKVSCAHCGKRVYSADSSGRNRSSLVWCKECSITNSQLLNKKCIIHLSKKDYEKTSYDGEGWKDIRNIEDLKNIPMKSVQNCTCDHCGKTFHDASFETGMVAWCKDCCGEKADLLKKVGIPGLEVGDYPLEGKVWGLEVNTKKLKLIAKKGVATNSTCNHCGIALHLRETLGEHIIWCRNCYEEDFSILATFNEVSCLQEIVNGRCWYPSEGAYAKIKSVPKIPNTVCDHCDKKFFAQCIATDPSKEYLSWCEDCCHTDAAALKSSGVSSDGDKAGINGYNWTLEEAKSKLKTIEKKANAICDHCEKKIRVEPGHLSPDAVYWCDGCAVLDESELKKHNLPVASSNRGYHSWIVNVATVKSIAKKNAIVRETPKKVELKAGQCPCHICGNATTDYNLLYKDPSRWYNTCYTCSVRITEIKSTGSDTSGITSKGSGFLQSEVDKEGNLIHNAVKQVTKEFRAAKKAREEVLAKEAEAAAKELEEIAAKAAARAAEIQATIAKKEAEDPFATAKIVADILDKKATFNMTTPNQQAACHTCGASCPDWSGHWLNFCEPCALKITKLAGKSSLESSIKQEHGVGLSESDYAPFIKQVKDELASTKEVADALNKMLEVVEDTMTKLEAAPIPLEKIQEIIDSFDKVISLDQGTLNTMAKAIGSKVAPNVEKLNLAKRVIETLSNNAYPFGGFVRDLYAFEDFKDIDFFFPRFDTESYPTNRFSGFEKCTLALKEKGFTLQALEEEKPLYVEAHHTKLIKKSYLVTDTKTGLSINIDLVRTNAGARNKQYDTPFLALDADINSLYFDKKTQTYKAANGYDTAKIIRNIENKVFEVVTDGEVLTKRINKLTEKGYTPTKNMTIDKTVLKVGDLVSLVISNPSTGASYVRDATVFSTEYGEIRGILSSAIDSTSGSSWTIVGSKDTAAAKKVGKTVGSEPLGWAFDNNTKITALHGNVFPPPPALDYKLLNIGDKVEMEYAGVDGAGNKFSYLGEGVILDVGDMDKGIFPISTIANGKVTNPTTGATVAAGGNPSAAQASLMQSYGISAAQVVRLDETLKAIKVIGKAETLPIDQSTLNLGDKVELEINLKNSNYARIDEKQTKTAWVVGITSGVRHFALETPAKSSDGSSSPCYYIPDYTEYNIEAKRLGIDTGSVRNGWKFQSDNTKIRKVLEKAPALIDPLTVEVGERYEVEVQPGRSGIATCIDKQSNGNPCWAFDKVPGMNLGAPNAAQIPLFQKYGVPGGQYTYWVNESSAKIRKHVGTANTYVEHKALVVGSLIDVEMNYNGKSYGTISAVVAEINASGQHLLTLSQQLPSMTGNATGIHAHAARVAGWDPTQCGSWVLQSNTDKIVYKAETPLNFNTKAFSEFKVGDLVEVEVLNGNVNFKTEALIGAFPGSGVVSLILKNRSDVAMNCDANLKKVAEKYGFESESTVYNVNSSSAVIHKALGKANIKSLPPNSLKVGDRIEVCFGHEPATTAVVIQSADESPYKEPIIAFEAETNGCWPLDDKQKDLAFKYGITAKRVGRRVDGNTTFVTKVIGRKSLSAGNLKPGDKLKLEFGPTYSNCTPLPDSATVIASSGDTAVVVLDEVYRDLTGNIANSKFPTPTEKELAKKVGITIADNEALMFSFTNSGAVVIKEVTTPGEIKQDKQMTSEVPEETINPASLQTGDRILMEIKEANGDEYEVEATALGIDYNGFPLVWLDEDMTKAFVFTQAANIKACEALGFDPKERRGWDLNPAKTKILEILDDKHEIEIEDIHIGDRIQVEFRDEDEVLFTKEGIYVGEDETSGLPVVYFTETISHGDEESWQADKNTVPYLAAEKLGFTPDTDQYMNLDYNIVIRKIVTRSKVELLQSDLEIEASDLQANEPDEVEEEEEEDEEFINPYDLEAGDKVEVKIVASQDEDSYITQIATVIDPDDVDGPLLALDEDFDLGEDETRPTSFKTLGKEVIKKAKQLGINPDKKVAWNADDYTTVLKVLSKSTNNSANAQNKEENMPYDTDGEEITMLDMLKADALSAGYRVAANQMTKGVKGALLLSMKDKGMDGGKIQAISEMLDTEMGEALISTLLGYGLTYIPGLGEDPRAQTLAEEFRINGIATAGNVIADSLFQHLLPAINSAMASLPPADEVLRLKKPARKRVATPKVEEKALVEATGSEEPVKGTSKRSGASA